MPVVLEIVGMAVLLVLLSVGLTKVVVMYGEYKQLKKEKENGKDAGK